MNTVKTFMVRKPSNLEEVLKFTRFNRNQMEIVEIIESINLTPEQYKEICEKPLEDYVFLRGKGGFEIHDGVEFRQVIELKCEGEQNLYADPSGSSYCRYLGIKLED